jgi:cysteinyl-tRNA synthetase
MEEGMLEVLSTEMAVAHGYRRADSSGLVISPSDQQTIDRVLLERQRLWCEADRLRVVLNDAGLHVDDNHQTYAVGVD